MKLFLRLLIFISLFFLLFIYLFYFKFKYNDYINVKTYDNKSDIVVCFIDNFKNENNKTGHGNFVYNVYNNFIDESNVIFLESVEFSFMSLKNTDNLMDYFYKYSVLNDCDIINYSMINRNRSKEYLDFLHNFISKFNGFIVASSGNDGLTTSASEWSELKSLYPEADWSDKLFIISQGFSYELIKKDSTMLNMVINKSYGSEVDYVIDKNLTIFENDTFHYNGSSFSAPFFTAYLYEKISNKDFNIKENLTFNFSKNKKFGLNDKEYYMFISSVN